jgi:hypothetical protein
MGYRSTAANVVDLAAFRQRKLMREERTHERSAGASEATVFVPVWVCWVPVWAPHVI